MTKTNFLYNTGDLVQFTYGHLGASVKKIGVVMEGASQPAAGEKVFKIRAEEKDYWLPASRIEMLSKVVKASSK